MRYRVISLELGIDGQVITWPGYSFGVLGLAVCRAPNGDAKKGYKPFDRKWQLIHVLSGRPIGGHFPSRTAAAAIGQKLTEIRLDWTCSGEELLADEALVEKARDIVYGRIKNED